MKRLIMIAGLLLVVSMPVLVACARVPESGVSLMPASESAPVPAPVAMAPQEDVEVAYKEAGEGDLPASGEERMIVRTGDASLVVGNVIRGWDEIAQLAVRLNGYVVSSRISGEEQDMRGWISIRVPAERFAQVLAELRELAVRVTSESTDSRDITEEYVDLESRLKNAETTENQYLALLEKAGEVEDIIMIYDSLSWVRREIGQIKGRIQYLERTSSMSLISVSLEPENTAKPFVRAGWSALEVLKSAVRGIVTFGQWLGTLALWLLIFTPAWGAILGVILWRRRWRQKA